MKRLLASVLILGLTTSSSAQDARTPTADSVRALREIVVEASRPVAGRQQQLLPLSAQRASSNLGELLERRAGLYIHSYGPGASAVARIRGWDGAHTAVVLDGVRLAHPATGEVDLSTIPTSFLEDAVLTRGPASRHGAIGGTVELRTRRIPLGTGASLAASVGPFGIREGAATASRGGRVGALVAIDLAQAPQSWGFGSGQRRLDAGRRRASLLAKGRTTLAGGHVQLQGFATESSTRLPGPANGAPRDAKQDEDLAQLRASYRRTTASQSTSLAVSAARSRSRFEDRPAATRTRTATHRLSVRAEVHRAKSHATGEVTRESLNDAGRLDTVVGLDLGRTGRFQSLAFGVGARSELRSRERLVLVPRLWLRREGRSVTMAASGGRSVRHPSFVERFWQPGGNPDLKSEQGWGGDVSLGVKRRAVAAELTVFAARLRDRIVWHPSLVSAGLQIWRPTNVGITRSQGIEARLVLSGPSRGVSATLSWTDTKDRTDRRAASFGKQVRYTPRTVGSMEAWLNLHDLSLEATAKRTGRRAIASDGSQHEPAYMVADLTASRGWLVAETSWRLSLVVRNALDADYAVVRLYPMPGRHLIIRLQIEH